MESESFQVKMQSDNASETISDMRAFNIKPGHYLLGNLGIYKVGRFLGEGGFGLVAQCEKLGSKEVYAVKIVSNAGAGADEVNLLKVIRELDADQCNLIRLFECFPYKGFCCLIFEMLDQNLFDFLCERNCAPLHLSEIRVIARQLLVALNGLKSIGVVHGDIKLDNVMLVNQYTTPLKVKLIDFGLARKAIDLPTGVQMQILPFRSPEVTLGLPLNEALDMWSVGISLAILYCGNMPFPSDCQYDTVRAMVQMYGLPGKTVLSDGQYILDFFTYELDENGEPAWRFKTPEEYMDDTGDRVEEYDHVTDLDSLPGLHRQMYEVHDDDDHQVFLRLLKKMMHVDPQHRISPSEALKDDFFTLKHLKGDKSKEDYLWVSKTALVEARLTDTGVADVAEVCDVCEVSAEPELPKFTTNILTANVSDCSEVPPAGEEGETTTDPNHIGGHGTSPASNKIYPCVEEGRAVVPAAQTRKCFRCIRKFCSRVTRFFKAKMTG